MPDLLLLAALLVLATTVAGLARILRGPAPADRMMAAQLLGTGGIAVLLLLAEATGLPGLVDTALTLAVLAAFASVALTKAAPDPDGDEETRR